MRKKGLSEIVSYVMLIVIAVALSTLVYSFLRAYVPKDKPECTDGINIVVEDYICENQELTVTLNNRGRFKINAAYVRIGRADREFRQWLNDPGDVGDDSFFLGDGVGDPGLFPGESVEIGPFSADSIVTSDGSYVLEVQPAVYTENFNKDIDDLGLCPPINQPIQCTSP